jgi:hypothetical protein
VFARNGIGTVGDFRPIGRFTFWAGESDVHGGADSLPAVRI